MVTVDLLIDLAADHPYHQATLAALRHAAIGINSAVRVVTTDEVDDDFLASVGRPRQRSVHRARHTVPRARGRQPGHPAGA